MGYGRLQSNDRRVRIVASLVREADGSDMVEYALLAAVVAVGAIAALNNFQGVISNVWVLVSNSLSGNS